MGTGLSVIHRSNYPCACLCWSQLSLDLFSMGRRRWGFAAFYCLWNIFRVFVICVVVFVAAVHTVITSVPAEFISSAQISAAASNSDHISVEQLWGSTLEGRLPPLTERFAPLCLWWEGMAPGRSRVPRWTQSHHPFPHTRTHSVLAGILPPPGLSSRHFQPIGNVQLKYRRKPVV